MERDVFFFQKEEKSCTVLVEFSGRVVHLGKATATRIMRIAIVFVVSSFFKIFAVLRGPYDKISCPESGTTAKIADFYLTAHFLAHVHSVVWRIFKQSAILLNHQSTSGMRILGSIDNYMRNKISKMATV